MKTFFRTLLIVTLSLVLIFNCAVAVFATENNDIDYATLFAQAQTVTPDAKQDYVTALHDAFSADDTAFLDALAEMNDDIVTAVVFMWVTGKTLNEIYDLRDLVVDCDTEAEYSGIINELNNEIGVREHALMMEPYMQYEDFDAPFSIPILRRFIDLNIANETFDTDEAFNHVLASAYETSPSIVAEILSNYSQTEIETLAKCVAADYVKLGKSLPVIPYDLQSDPNEDIINLVQEEIACSLNPQIETETITLEPPSVEMMSTCVPTIGTMTYTTAPLVVGQTETLSITFSESGNISSVRQWYVEIFVIAYDSDTTDTLIKAQTIGISPGVVTATVNFNVTFSNPYSFYTYIKVYTAEGGTLLTTKLGTSSDTVVGYWYINVNLPSDRNEYGVLRLSNCNNSILLTADCLGKSASDLPANKIGGHTPTGTYTGLLRGPDDDVAKYGPYKFVDMDGISGQIVDECSERDGILIHGGRSQEVLEATDGCIRVFNSTQKDIQEIIESLISDGHETRGYIFVS